MSKYKYELLKIEVEQKNNAKGGIYKVAKVDYKDLGSGKPGSKNVMSFGVTEKGFLALAALQGQTPCFVEVDVTKNDKGFNDWISVEKSAAPQASAGPVQGKPYEDPRETPEERAKKQIYITRMACINSSIEFHKLCEGPTTFDSVLSTAKTLENYVFGEVPELTGSAFDDFEDSIPF